MQYDLKPCPFCGGKVVIDMLSKLDIKTRKPYYYIRCSEKDCNGRNSSSASKDELITNWNKRADKSQ